jgi:16S rRNA (uracil1498-N3)-methyltransferase
VVNAPKRVFVDPGALPQSPTRRPVDLPDDAAHYVRNVLRLDRGDHLEILDGTGRIIRGQIQSIGETGVKLAPQSDEMTDRHESPCAITLYQAIPKGDRWRMVLEKTTELGIRRLVPVETDRTVVEVPADRLDSKMNRWRRIIGNATRQCARSRTPELNAPMPLGEALDETSRPDHDVALAAHEQIPEDASLRDALEAVATTGDDADSMPSIGVWVGPEGGFTADERKRLQQSGVQPVRFGSRILRSETAGIAAVTAAQLICGDL